MQRRKILFLTGTRADFGKLKPLMQAVESHDAFDCIVFATGMHMLKLYGGTVYEVRKTGFSNVHAFVNQIANEPMDLILSNTIAGLSRFVHETTPDMIVVHGDRVEALAGAVVGALRNILVAHIEGGELSGTVDELIRHAVSKLSHVHFVANEEAASRLIQMGERRESVFVIGSPDIDVMLSERLPSLAEAKQRYGIEFDKYGLALFHPVTTELDRMRDQAREFFEGILLSERNTVVVYPNNDEGAVYIMEELDRLRGRPRIAIFPSIRFEYFLTLLKHCTFVAGNSSVGIREAPVYGIPTVNVGSRQLNRHQGPTIENVEPDRLRIADAIRRAGGRKTVLRSTHFGDGSSLKRFRQVLDGASIWAIPKQKQFVNISDRLSSPFGTPAAQFSPIMSNTSDSND